MGSREMNPGVSILNHPHAGATRGPRIRAGLTLALMYVLLVFPAVVSQRGGTNEADDEQGHHIPVIETMAAQWPGVDLVHYESATSPGYHLFFAALHRYAGIGELTMRLINALVSLAMVMFIWRMAARFINPWPALALVLAFLCSTYVLGSAIWLTTDNASLFLALIAVGGASLLRPTAMRVIGWSAAATAAVLVRQIHLWCAAPVMLAFILLTPVERFMAPWLGGGNDLRIARTWASLWLIPIVLLPFVVLGWLAWMWGGLMPPMYADLHNAGPNPATPAVALSVCGAFGVFFLPIFLRIGQSATPRRHELLLIALAIACTLLVPTSYNKDAGRWGGAIWEVARVLPSIADRSIVLPVLGVLGAYVLIMAWRACRASGRQREAIILLLSLLGWLVAQSMNTQAWQRYAEPILLVALAWLAGLAMSPAQTPDIRTDSTSHRALAGPLALAVIQFIIACWKVYWPMFHAGVA